MGKMLYKILLVLVKSIIYPIFRVEVHGRENLPEEGSFILCGNHWSNWDPIFLAGAFNKPISFMGKKELFDIKILGKVLESLNAFPVDRDNVSLNSLRRSVEIINDGKILGMFPEGTRVSEIDRKNMKDGAGYIALKADSDIVPVEILSTYKPFRKTKIIFKKHLKIDDYKKYKRKIAMEKLMDDTFLAIYENRKELMSGEKN